MFDVAGLSDCLEHLTVEERVEFDRLLGSAQSIWSPLPGPQTMAYYSIADVVGYGGAAGGGKSDLAIGKALTRHRESMIFRPVGTELIAIRRRIKAIVGSDDGYNGRDQTWELPDGRIIEFGAVPNLGDEVKQQGRPHDLKAFDEAANFLEQVIRFLMTWNRTTIPGQHCQTLLTFNPPTTAEGRWVIPFFAPWLDKRHPCPAMPGELRYFVMLRDQQGNSYDLEVPDARPRVQVGTAATTDFDPSKVNPLEVLVPKSRTFIPSRVSDNPYLMGTGYMATLQALPEPLRSQMLYGDFEAGIEDDPWQVIPTAWVERAMERWKPRSPKGRMDSMGVDVARGGKDNTIISRRHDRWYDELLAYPGAQTPDGPSVMGMVVTNRRDSAPVHIDVIGVGASPYDFLVEAKVQTIGVNVAEAATGTDRSGMMTFANQRAQLWWAMREALDPAYDTGVELPRDPRLLADLCAPRWRPQGRTIVVEDRESIIKRIGRSPDYASAVILAQIDTPRLGDLPIGAGAPPRPPHDPYARIEHDRPHTGGRQTYDPYARLR